MESVCAGWQLGICCAGMRQMTRCGPNCTTCDCARKRPIGATAMNTASGSKPSAGLLRALDCSMQNNELGTVEGTVEALWEIPHKHGDLSLG